ncbi:MAG: DUF11 domain-containing protein [Acidobacteriota bacterium]|nr:DUF11 domain-containing protein [Acidobacteriota bacterium]
MAHTYIKRFTLGVALTLLMVAFAADSFAAGTPAGTVISNTATADYEDANANALQAISNTVTTTVNQVSAVDISPPTGSLNADPGDLVCYAHTVSNNGNDAGIIDIATSSSQGFTVTVYEDVNTNGTYESGTDTLLTDTGGSADVDTGILPDSVSSPGNNSIEILVCIAVPAGTADGTVDATDIDIASVNDPGATDSATDTTTVQSPDLGVVKSVSPVGNQPPGTTLTYTIVVTNNGAVDALNIVLTDPVPANTTYVGSSITQDAATRTDGADGDNADHDDTNAGEVTVAIGTLASGASTTIVFEVMID